MDTFSDDSQPDVPPGNEDSDSDPDGLDEPGQDCATGSGDESTQADDPGVDKTQVDNAEVEIGDERPEPGTSSGPSSGAKSVI